MSREDRILLIPSAMALWLENWASWSLWATLLLEFWTLGDVLARVLDTSMSLQHSFFHAKSRLGHLAATAGKPCFTPVA